ncbi:MAG: aldehyde ferredoxin oxidoreductase family protein, partial [Candidatus Bathyarchaeia archaeon]
KFAGFDGIVLSGASVEPVYLWVHDGGAEIRDAGHIWGKNSHETEALVKGEVGKPNASVASIGLGGENLVLYACVLSDLNRAAGRTGVGAVMGSKRLKAVAVYGTQRVSVADEDGTLSLAKEIRDRLLSHRGTLNMRAHGTPYGVPTLNEKGILPTQNFISGVFEGALDICGETMTKTILKRRPTCFACPVCCIRVCEVKEGPYAGDFNDGPEYETVASLGSLCRNRNLPSIAYANHLCNLYTIDTISTGSAIAFAMECYEKGLITDRDTGGIALTWGNPDAIVQMTEKIARREGFGDVLADGVKRAAEKIGRGAEAFGVQVKGLETGMHEPRGKKGVGLMYMTANRGGVHTDATHDTSFEKDDVLPELGLVGKMDRLQLEGKAELIKTCQDLVALIDCMIICFFTANPTYRPVTITDLIDITNATTGWDLDLHEFMTIGERINNLGRAFNVREGLTRRDDGLPKRFTEPMVGGVIEGQAIPREDQKRLLDEYYELRGWRKRTGVPGVRKLRNLGLDFVAEELRRLRKL